MPEGDEQQPEKEPATRSNVGLTGSTKTTGNTNDGATTYHRHPKPEKEIGRNHKIKLGSDGKQIWKGVNNGQKRGCRWCGEGSPSHHHHLRVYMVETMFGLEEKEEG